MARRWLVAFRGDRIRKPVHAERGDLMVVAHGDKTLWRIVDGSEPSEFVVRDAPPAGWTVGPPPR